MHTSSMNTKTASRLMQLFFCFWICECFAHEIGQSYLILNIQEEVFTGHIEITLVDLEKALKLDTDNDSKVSSDELESNIGTVHAYLSKRISIGNNNVPYTIKFTKHKVGNYKLGKYAIFSFVADNYSGGIPEALEIEYSLIFDVDPNHRGLLFLDDAETTPHITIFSPKRQKQTISLNLSSKLNVFLKFIAHGVWHIWIGIDHILFLIALILLSVVRREENQWIPVSTFRPAFINIVKIVSVFTVAHSITLSLAALRFVNLSPRMVESVIAASVVIAAVNNIFPFFLDRMWWVIFGFGLFHGFGFANVLSHLGLQEGSLALALFGFNVGVELGQIAIILVAFPLCFLIRRGQFYPKFVLNLGSAMITLVATKWFIERAFDINS